MADPRLYEQDAFVLLESGKPEELLSVDELKCRLIELVNTYPSELPDDVAALETANQQVQCLIDSYCELSIGANRFFQWFAVRLEKD